MKRNTLLAGFTGLALALTTPFVSAAEGWMTDFKAAQAQAEKEDKALLVDFTGSDWCGWCIKLVDEVFKHDEFKKGVADKYVLVELDYPRDKSKLSEATLKQNEELKNKYGIRGFPTILIMDAEGRPFAKTGYQAGGPGAYLTHLDTLNENLTKRDAALTAAEKLEGVAKAKALVEALSVVPEEYQNQYSDVIADIKQLDAKDETGFIAQQEMKEARKNLDADILKAARAGDTPAAIATIDQFIADHNVTGEAKQEILTNKINILFRAKEADAAAKVVDEIIEISPDSRTGKALQSFKETRLPAIMEQMAK